MKPTSRLDIIDPLKTTRLIGRECKHSNVFSGPILIGHLLNQNVKVKLIVIDEHQRVYTISLGDCKHLFAKQL